MEHFARRQPVLFVGGAFTLGLLAARFLKSSGQRSSSRQGTGQPAIRGYLPAAGQTSASRPRGTGAYTSSPPRAMPASAQMPGRYPMGERGMPGSSGAYTAPSTQHTPTPGAAQPPLASTPHASTPQAGHSGTTGMPGSGSTAGPAGGSRPGTGMTPGRTPDGGRP